MERSIGKHLTGWCGSAGKINPKSCCKSFLDLVLDQDFPDEPHDKDLITFRSNEAVRREELS